MIRMITRAGIAGLLAAGLAAAQTGGKFYGVHWDGSAEHFVEVDPVAGTHSSVVTIPGVKWIDATFRVFDPDGSRFAFIGGDTAAGLHYQVVDATTGSVVNTFPRTENLKNPAYDPGTGMLYGALWAPDPVTGDTALDSLGNPFFLPAPMTGTERFVTINTLTGARTETPIPGVRAVSMSGHFFDIDSGRYVFHAIDTANTGRYYVIDVATGDVIDAVPVGIRIDFPVYNPALGAVHGLWWNDSSVTMGHQTDSVSGLPIPTSPLEIRGAEYFVTLHRDSTIDLVELPGVKYIANFNRALDTDSGRYVFTGMEATGGLRYYVIDVATGAILSKTPAAGKVDHLVYAPLASTAGPTGVSPMAASAAKAASWSLRRGPDGSAELTFANAAGEPHAFALRDMTGRVVWSRAGIRTGSLRVEASGLKAGVYVFALRNTRGVAASGRLVVD